MDSIVTCQILTRDFLRDDIVCWFIRGGRSLPTSDMTQWP